MSLDLADARALGEEIRARLFPTEGPDGRTPYPLPVAIRYPLSDGDEVPVLFVPERCIQRIGEPVPDVPASLVRVVWEDDLFTVDLVFEAEPEVPDLGAERRFGAEREQDAWTDLLRAVTGVL